MKHFKKYIHLFFSILLFTYPLPNLNKVHKIVVLKLINFI